MWNQGKDEHIDEKVMQVGGVILGGLVKFKEK